MLTAFIFVPTKINAASTIGITMFSPGLEKGLIAHWTFDGPNMISNVADTSGQGNTSRLINMTATTSVRGVLGQALLFDGTNDYANAGLMSGVGSTSAITVSAWIKADTITGGDSNVRYVISQTFNYFWTTFLIRLNTTSDYMEFMVGGGSSYSTPATTGASSIAANTWYHVVGVYDGAQTVMYLNGVAKTPVARTGAVGSVNAEVHLGNAWRGGINDSYFSGAIDDVRVYNRVLSSEEIKRLYGLGATTHIGVTPLILSGANAGLGYGLVGHWTFDGPNMISNVADSSGQGNKGMLSGQTSTSTVAGVIGQALSFDGVDDGVITAAPVTTQTTNISMSAWVYSKATTQTALILYNGNSGSNGYGFFVSSGTCGSGSEIGVLLGGGNCDAVSSNTTLPTGRWVHLGLTRDATTWRLYLDGVEIHTGTANPITPGTATEIGSNTSFANNFNGIIDDARIYSRTLSAEEIKRLYGLGATTHIGVTPTSGGQGLDSGLVGHYTFDGSNMISNIADTSGQGNTGYLINQSPTTTVIGRIGQALKFDGTNDYVDTGTNIGISGNSARTASFWFYPNSSSGRQTLVNWGTAGDDQLWWVEYNGFSGGPNNIYVGGLNNDAYTTATLSTGAWHHVTVVYPGTTNTDTQIYYDGVAQTVVGNGGSQGALNTTNAPISIGYDDVNNRQPFNGTLDDVRIYNRVLSPAEVKRLYDLGR
jgi:hypothetical protein